MTQCCFGLDCPAPGLSFNHASSIALSSPDAPPTGLRSHTQSGTSSIQVHTSSLVVMSAVLMNSVVVLISIIRRWHRCGEVIDSQGQLGPRLGKVFETGAKWSKRPHDDQPLWQVLLAIGAERSSPEAYRLSGGQLSNTTRHTPPTTTW